MSSPGRIPSTRLDPGNDEVAKEGSAATMISAPQRLTALEAHPLSRLRQFTPARIALGRTGYSLPTRELLEFGVAHAMARDAVNAPFDIAAISKQLTAAQLSFIQVSSAAVDRPTYLRRPDLGRKLDAASRSKLSSLELPAQPEVIFIVADGLSALAPQCYAVKVIQATRYLLQDWKIGPIVLAERARVAIGDEVGEILKAEIAVMLIGERPGLSSPDSLGIYLTYAPRIGRTDAERNCISNVRVAGMSPELAAQTLCQLLVNARRLKLSGVLLKDESHQGMPSFAREKNPSAQRQLKSD